MSNLPANVERFLFEVSGCEERLRVVSFGSSEAISQLFNVELELATENSELDFTQLIGQAGVLTIVGEEEERYFHGMISRFEQGGSGIRFTSYHATLVPKIWYLGHRYNCRIFQKMNVKDIVKKLLREAGIPSDEYRFVLQHTPPTRDYCVQYRESELNFITRLLEEEGIFYFFKHQADKHILIMGDDSSAYLAIQGEETVIFHEPRPGQVADEEHIYYFHYTEEVLPGKVSLKDYNFKKPALNLQGEYSADQDDELEIYDYPGEFDDPTRGTCLAKMRLQEQQAIKKIGTGETTTNRFAAGFFFTMAEYPYRESFNQEYLLTRVQQSGSQPQVLEETGGEGGSGYSSSFQCMPIDVPYRPARFTPKPIVEGSQTAIVVGPKGEEIYTDEHGRVKVQFHWDRRGQMNQDSSCWIRVSQYWAGAKWGALYMPRIGHEVIVDFLEGDPDRPIIIGRVYHGTNKPPYLPAEKTKSTVKSNSSKGGGGFNEICFEDQKGQEQIGIHAQRRMDIKVRGSFYETNYGNREVRVGSEKGGDYNVFVKQDENIQVEKGRYELIEKKLNQTVKEDVVYDFQQNVATMVGLKSELNAQQVIIEASQKISLKVGGNFVVIDRTGVSINGTMVKINSGGSATATGNPTIEDPIEAAGAAPCKKPGSTSGVSSRAARRSRRIRTLRSQHAPSILQATARRRPTPSEIQEVDDAISDGRHQDAIDLAVRHYDIDTSNVPGGVRYDPTESNYGVTSFDSRVNLGQPAFSSPEVLASTIVHETTHANQADALRASDPSLTDWPTDAEAVDYDEAMAYDAELQSAANTGLDGNPTELGVASTRRDTHYNNLPADMQESLDNGDYPP